MARTKKTAIKMEAPLISFDSVMELARKWYYTEIRSLADDAIARALKEAHADEDTRRTWLARDVEETTDDHAFIIYTAQAGMVCAASDNDGAYEDDIGENPPTIEAQACMAMRADVWQVIDARTDEWIPAETTDE